MRAKLRENRPAEGRRGGEEGRRGRKERNLKYN